MSVAIEIIQEKVLILLQVIPKRLPQKEIKKPYNYIREIGLKLIEMRNLIENCKIF